MIAVVLVPLAVCGANVSLPAIQQKQGASPGFHMAVTLEFCGFNVVEPRDRQAREVWADMHEFNCREHDIDSRVVKSRLNAPEEQYGMADRVLPDLELPVPRCDVMQFNSQAWAIFPV